jgi:L-iditol 2-dehydrogenase
VKVVAITGAKQCELADRPDPKAGKDIAVVKILVAPMCTEYKAYANGWQSDCLGHEAAGEVVQVAQPGKVAVGDRVVVMPLWPCGGCPLCLAGEYIHCTRGVDVLAATGSQAGCATYAQYCLKSDWLLLPIPAGLSYEHASMACCGLGPAFGAMRRMQVDSFDTVLVTGLGPVGLGGVIHARYLGARVIGVESHPYRAELARRLGAEAVVAPGADALQKIMDLTGGVGADKAVDCSGAPEAQRLMIDALRRRGQGCFVGEAGDLTIAVSNHMIRKGISLHGQWHWNLADAPRMMQMIAAVPDQLNKLITHVFPMRKVKDAWDLQLTGQCGKVLLHPWD